MQYFRLFRLSSIVILVLSSVVLTGQKLDHILGEFIVQVASDKDMYQASKNINVGVRNSDRMFTRQLMAEPLNIWLVKIDPNMVNEIDFHKKMESQKGIVLVKKNRLISLRNTPNDPSFSKQWQYINDGSNGGVAGADMDIDMAWDVTTGGISTSGDTIVVCVIDNGINANHEDLVDNLWKNRFEIPKNGQDDDGNGFIDDVRGWNAELANDSVYYEGNHGTQVAGIIGAKGNNGKGVSGVNWNVKLMVVKYGNATEANALASYAYPYQMRKLYNQTNGQKGAFVVATNASWGIDEAFASEAPLWCNIFDSLGQVGILNCGATANRATDVDQYGDLPTSCTSEYLIAVTNLNRSDIKVNAAGYGKKSIDIGAYGEGVYTVGYTGYSSFGGTSGATPHVTGMIGLLYSAPCPILINLAKSNPGNAALVVKDMILHGVTANGSLAGITTTGGKLNAQKSMSNIMNLCGVCSLPAGIKLEALDEEIKVNWANNSGNAVVRLRYRNTNDLNWTIIQNVSKGQVISNLNHCTEYEIQFGANCGIIPNEYSYSKYISTSGCCDAPTILESLANENQITAMWNGFSNNDYIIEYKNLNNDWTKINSDTNFVLIDNLPSCTSYSLRIKSICHKYEEESVYSKTLDLPTSCGPCTDLKYCNFGLKNNEFEWIDSFQIGNNQIFSGPGDDGYKNFAGIVNINLIKDQTYHFSITPKYNSASAYADFYKILVDWNQDGQFDGDEIAFETPSAVKNKVEGDIIVPSNVTLGTTKLRIIITYTKFEGGCDVSDFEFGEVEDYCVQILKNDCILPDVNIGQVNKTFVTFVSNSLDTLLFSYREKGESTWREFIGRENIHIENLNECTVYEYFYKAKCGILWSESSKIDTVKTSCKNATFDFDLTEFTLSPNPTISKISITSGIYGGQVKIYHISGMEVPGIYKILPNSKKEFDTSSLVPGVYLVELTNHLGNKMVKKMIKL